MAVAHLVGKMLGIRKGDAMNQQNDLVNYSTICRRCYESAE